MDRALFGDRPWGYHLTVVLAHACVTALVCLLALSLLRDVPSGRWAALSASLLFAAHPIHTESVAWIAGRADVLAALFVLGAALALRRRPAGWPSLAASLALFAAGCLCKEVAFAFVPLVPLFAHGCRSTGVGAPAARPAPRRGGRRDAGVAGQSLRSSASLRAGSEEGDAVSRPARGRGGERPAMSPFVATAAFALTGAAVLALRAAALGGLGADAPRTSRLLDSLERLGGALDFYLAKAALPLVPAPYQDRVPGGAAAWAGLAAAGAVALAGLALIRRGGWRAGPSTPGRDGAVRAAGVGIAGFLVFLLPSLSPAVMKVSTVPVAERYLYLPTAMLALAAAGGLGLLLEARPAWRKGIAVAVLGLVAAGAAGSWARARIWRDDLSLWSAAVRATDAPAPRIFLATALVEAGRGEEAETIYRSLLSAPSRLDARQRALATMNLGIVLRMRGDGDGALEAFEEATRLDPGAPLGWYNLATMLWETAMLDPASGTADAAKVRRAVEAGRRAERLAPLDPKILLFLGQAQAALGVLDEARPLLERASRLDPAGEVGAQARAILARLGRRG